MSKRKKFSYEHDRFEKRRAQNQEKPTKECVDVLSPSEVQKPEKMYVLVSLQHLRFIAEYKRGRD